MFRGSFDAAAQTAKYVDAWQRYRAQAATQTDRGNRKE